VETVSAYASKGRWPVPRRCATGWTRSRSANLERARRLLAGTLAERDRHRRGLYLSAARSLLFNRVLAARVQDGSWCRLLAGEAVALEGSNSFFVSGSEDPDLRRRLARFDIHPSGPLCGAGDSPAKGEALAVEQRALAGDETWVDALARYGLSHARRALRVAVRDIEVVPDGDRACWLAFALGAGAYATVVLRELFELDDATLA
jgi:tRNA pseudouridine13 synthase